jgi:hypothetical protein
MTKALAWALALGCMGALGCLPESSADVEARPGEGLTTEQFALVTLTAQHPRTQSEPGLPTAVRAHFVEATGVSREDVAAALALWTPRADEGCVVETRRSAAPSLDAAVRLRSAGVLGVSGNGSATRLEPRAVPAYIPQFAGVVYGADQPGVPTYASAEPYLVWADGADVAPFATGLRAPAPVEWTRVNGRDPGSAVALESPATDGLNLEFVSDADTVFVSIRNVAELGGAAIECRLTGTRALEIGADDVHAVFGADARLELVARTVTTAPIAAEGDAAVSFEFHDRLELRVATPSN